MAKYGSLARASSCYFDHRWRVNQAMSLGEFTNDDLLQCIGWGDGFALVPYTGQCPRQYYSRGEAFIRQFTSALEFLSNGVFTQNDLMFGRAVAFVRGNDIGFPNSVGNTFTNDAWEWAKALFVPNGTLALMNGNRVILATDVFSATDSNPGQEPGGTAIRPDLPNTEFAPSYDGYALIWIQPGDVHTWLVFANSGQHTFRMEYSNGQTVNAVGTWTFNGGQAINISTVAIPTGGWSTYSTLTLSTTLTLVRGWNEITLTGANDLNINKLQVQRN